MCLANECANTYRVRIGQGAKKRERWEGGVFSPPQAFSTKKRKKKRRKKKEKGHAVCITHSPWRPPCGLQVMMPGQFEL